MRTNTSALLVIATAWLVCRAVQADNELPALTFDGLQPTLTLESANACQVTLRLQNTSGGSIEVPLLAVDLPVLRLHLTGGSASYTCMESMGWKAFTRVFYSIKYDHLSPGEAHTWSIPTRQNVVFEGSSGTLKKLREELKSRTIQVGAMVLLRKGGAVGWIQSTPVEIEGSTVDVWIAGTSELPIKREE